MVSNRDVLGYLKVNVGEESVIKMMVYSAIKSLFSVAIIVGGIASSIYLAERYGALNVYPIIVSYLFFTLMWATVLLNLFQSKSGIEANQIVTHPLEWKKLGNVLHFKKLLYFDWDGNDASFSEQLTLYFASVFIGGLFVIVALAIGVMIIFSCAFVYSFFLALNVPSESLITFVTVGGSILLMSILFIKLKWKKIFLEGTNWNLIAWCVCAAVIITVMAFVTGVAIRRIAGYIGIEYTAGLVAIYVIITAIYVINDIRQWMDNKMREAAKKVAETQSISPSNAEI